VKRVFKNPRKRTVVLDLETTLTRKDLKACVKKAFKKGTIVTNCDIFRA